MYNDEDVNEAIINKDVYRLQSIVNSNNNHISNDRLLELQQFIIKLNKYEQAIYDLWLDVEDFNLTTRGLHND